MNNNVPNRQIIEEKNIASSAPTRKREVMLGSESLTGKVAASDDTRAVTIKHTSAQGDITRLVVMDTGIKRTVNFTGPFGAMSQNGADYTVKVDDLDKLQEAQGLLKNENVIAYLEEKNVMQDVVPLRAEIAKTLYGIE